MTFVALTFAQYLFEFTYFVRGCMVESLELSLNQITGTIPSSLQQLTSLKYFGVAFNELTDAVIPTVLGRMTSLQSLNMRSSQIRGTIPTELGQLARLSEFDMYWKDRRSHQ
jgi:Leucine-rich repeat (LRR) protein